MYSFRSLISVSVDISHLDNHPFVLCIEINQTILKKCDFNTGKTGVETGMRARLTRTHALAHTHTHIYLHTHTPLHAFETTVMNSAQTIL